MKILKSFSLIAVGLSIVAISTFAQQDNLHENAVFQRGNDAPRYVPGEVIVKLKSSDDYGVRRNAIARNQSATDGSMNQLLNQIGASEMKQLMPLTGGMQKKSSPRKAQSTDRMVEDVDLSQLYLIQYDENKGSVEAVVEQLKTLDEVEYAEPNYLMKACATEDLSAPNDPLYEQQYGLKAIRMPEVWSLPLKDKKRPVIAILDTGVDITHPDLAKNIWTNQAEATGNVGTDDDANGRADDVHGWNFVDLTNDVSDQNGHGTHVAGIAAAVGNNGIGITGANPDALIMPVKVLQNNGEGSVGAIAAGIDYAIANGADVINMSFGSYYTKIGMEPNEGESDPLTLRKAIEKAYMNNIILVAAAGNDHLDIFKQADPNVFPYHMYPAAYDVVLGVMATDENNRIASYSNYQGRNNYAKCYGYEVAAPGSKMMSTLPGGQYKALSGTSMASGLVAGAVSRLLQTKGYDYSRDYGMKGDFILLRGEGGEIVDLYAVSQMEEALREADLSLDGIMKDLTGDADGVVDAGETITITPVVGSVRGHINDLTIKIAPYYLSDEEMGKNESDLEKDFFYKQQAVSYLSPEYYDITTASVDFGYSLNTSAKAIEGKEPFVINIHDDAPNNHRLAVEVSAEYQGKSYSARLEYLINSIEEISGVIDRDTILPAKELIVRNFAILPGVTVRLSEGSVINFYPEYTFVNYGTLIAPKKSIVRCFHTYSNDIDGYHVEDDGEFYPGEDTKVLGWMSLEDVGSGSYLKSQYNPWTIHGDVHDLTAAGHLYIKNAEIIDGLTGNNVTVINEQPSQIAIENVEVDRISVGDSNDGGAFNAYTDSPVVNIKNMTCHEEFLVKSGTIKGYNISAPVFSPFPILEYYEDIWDANICPLSIGIDSIQTYYSHCKFDEIHFADVLSEAWPFGFVIKMDSCTVDTMVYVYSNGPYLINLNRGYNIATPSFYFDYCNIIHGPYYFGNSIVNCNLANYWGLYITPGEWKCPKCGNYVDKLIGYIEKGDWQGSRCCENCILELDIDYLFGEDVRRYPNNILCSLVTDFDVMDKPHAEDFPRMYIGSSSIDYIKKHKLQTSVWWPASKLDLSNLLLKPLETCPSMVWKVIVDGFDAQDQFEEMPPLGSGKHKVEVYFNKAMDKTVAPVVAMGLSAPYTQRPINEEASWNEDGTIYTAYITITGKSNTDGVNRISVRDAKGLDDMVIMTEDTRFNVNIQVAGALSTSLIAEAGAGKVSLSWETEESDIEDLMGYNIYRYTVAGGDTIMVNESLINPDKKEYVDYDVTPGVTYYYIIKEMSTDLQQNDVSGAVSATPLDARLGDVDDSGSVDLLDVVSTIAFINNQRPRPFIVKAADMNGDNEVNSIDVGMIVKQILSLK